MNKVKLTNDITVSSVCLGAMNFGTSTDEKSSYAVLDAYISAGGNFIDTSNNYAHWQGTGDESETLLGKYLRERGNRDKLIIATKVGFDRHGEGAGLKKAQIEYWIDESLRKLGTDYVDLYYAHTDDVSTPLEETMAAFDSLVRNGKVRVLGGSNYDTWRFMEANAVAAAHDYAGFEVMQQRFSYLAERGDVKPKYAFNEFTDRERLRYLAAKNIPLVAYSCLCKGGYEKPGRMPSTCVTGARLDKIREFAAEKGISVSAAVVAYLTNIGKTKGMPTVIPLFSSSNPEHFIENLRGADVTLTVEELEMLINA